MDIRKLAKETRSVRRFLQDARPEREELLDFIDSARLAPCGANLQLIRFSAVSDPDRCRLLFPALNWAGYLSDWDGPAEDERPTGYIVIHVPGDRRRHIPVDAGIAAAYIVLAARGSGFGSCMIMSFDPDTLLEALKTPEGYEPFLVIAFGVPGEKIVLEEATDSIRYYRDASGVHHVPKLKLEEIVLSNS
ncbi:MAG: nitroreductase [Candidatus Aegiribacteria sp.]|nr:nitroreductase [Candidatus Aegiribacteria sp.]